MDSNDDFTKSLADAVRRSPPDYDLLARAEAGRRFLEGAERKERARTIRRKLLYDAVSLGSAAIGAYAFANGNARGALIAGGVLAVAKLVEYRSLLRRG